MRLEIGDWRRAAVLSFLRTGKCLLKVVIEVRLVCNRYPALRFSARSHALSANPVVMLMDPDTGLSLRLNARNAEDDGIRHFQRGIDFADEGGLGRTCRGLFAAIR